MPVCSCNTCMSGCTCINNGNNAMAIMQWVLLPALATHSTRLVCVAHTTVCSVAMLPYLLSVRAAVVVARVPGRPGFGGRTNRAARVSSARTIGHTCKHANTRTRTHTHTRRHSLRPRRSLRRLSSLSPPVVLVTTCRACHCHVCSAAMLPCLLSVRAAVVLRGPRSVEMPAVAASSMTQIDGWMRGAVKARKGWPITPFRGSGNGNWLIFGSFSLN